jgi:hypothetical protein
MGADASLSTDASRQRPHAGHEQTCGEGNDAAPALTPEMVDPGWWQREEDGLAVVARVVPGEALQDRERVG